MRAFLRPLKLRSKLPIKLGKHTLQSHYALAPMAGLTDVPFRTLAWHYGAGYMVSEMVSSKPELWETGKSRARRIPVAGVTPNAVQLAGTDPQVMAESARRHVDEGVDVIDLNFGCPAKKVCKKSAGSALLADLSLLAQIVGSVVAAVDVPVTVKTRTGLVPQDGVGLMAAQIAEAEGAQMVVMHARSRACRFVGPVDYAAVRKTKQAVSIPLLVNGDITDRLEAQRVLTLTQADGVMLGRGAFGRPWIFAQLRGATVTASQQWDSIEQHLQHMHEFYGNLSGVRIARKHMVAYAESLDLARADVEIGEFLRLQNATDQIEWLGQIRRRVSALRLQQVA